MRKPAARHRRTVPSRLVLSQPGRKRLLDGVEYDEQPRLVTPEDEAAPRHERTVKRPWLRCTPAETGPKQTDWLRPIGGGFAAIRRAVGGLVLSEARRRRHPAAQAVLAAWAEGGRVHAPATTREARHHP